MRALKIIGNGLSLCLILAPVYVVAVVTHPEDRSYPDPTKENGFLQCGMSSKSLRKSFVELTKVHTLFSVCDVDRVLTESQRIQLNKHLINFENATYDVPI
jgi:hypothetical protein